MNTARKQAVQKNAKAKKTQAKALKIIKPTKGLKSVGEKLEDIKKANVTKSVKQGNEIIADPLAGGVKATVERYFESATTLGKAGETTTAIMIECAGWNAGKRVKKGDSLRVALLKKLHTNLETLEGRPLQNLKKNVKATQRLFNKKGVQDRLLGKERTKRVYFGGLDHLTDKGLITTEQVKTEGLTAGEYCFTTIEAKPVTEQEYKSRQEINEKHTEEHRPALNSKQEDKDEYLYDLTATLKHIQEEIKAFSK